MKIDAAVGDLAGAAKRVRELEALGYDGVITAEVNADPFLPLAVAAEHSTRVDLITSIAVAFARNPMTLAQTAHDLQRFSGGRMVLGLGSQIKPHITKRFSMPWSHPAARMRELILAMRAIWATWNDGAKLEFRGEYYTHTLMTPMFMPERSAAGPPRVWLAAVGELMTEVAGEVADGLLLHAFTNERYLREVTLPALDRGLARAGRTRADVEVVLPGFVVTGADDAEMERNADATRKQIAFYGSTPAYRPVLEIHGWGAIADELNGLSKQGRWDDMGSLIDDEILDTFAVRAAPERLARTIIERHGGIVDRTTIFLSQRDPDTAARVIAELRAG